MASVKVSVLNDSGQDTGPNEGLEKIVNWDIDRFEEFFRGLGNDGLSGPERSIIKTYIWWKTHSEDQDG